MTRILPCTCLLLLTGCGFDIFGADGGSTGMTPAGPFTTSDSTSTSSSTGASTSTGGADETMRAPNSGFVDDDADVASWAECSILTQDCPAGLKCVPYPNGVGWWDTWSCVPIAEDPAGPGEPCTAEDGGASGIDDCALGSMCWNVDSKTNEGYCVAFCVGDDGDLFCEDPDSACTISSEGTLLLCLPSCHPLEGDCLEGQGCYFTPGQFLCAPDASGDAGEAGDPCEFINACDPGTFCADADSVPSCVESIGCCSSFCTLGDDSTCLPGQTCQPWFGPGETPLGYEDLGGCALP